MEKKYLKRSNEGKWVEVSPEEFGQSGTNPRGLGDVVEKIAKPIARALGLDCINQLTGELKPNSKCAQRRKWLNRKFPNPTLP